MGHARSFTFRSSANNRTSALRTPLTWHGHVAGQANHRLEKKVHMNRRSTRAWTVAIVSSSALALAAIGVASRALADPPRQMPPHTPPPEAFKACEGKGAGDACSLRLHDMDIDGTCGALPGQSALVCRPSHPPSPPPEAFSACEGKPAGSACSVKIHGTDVSGTCGSLEGDTRLLCRPKDLPPPPPRDENEP
jgi:hypothetical protein